MRAEVFSGRLLVSGAAGQTSSYNQVDVSFNGYSPITVRDNGLVAVDVPVSYDASSVTSLDLSRLTGAGASVSWYTNVDGRVTGSGSDDYIASGDGRQRLLGGNGNDYIDGGAGNDTLWGGNGNDRLFGGDGDDLIFFESGFDTIDGGLGSDTIQFNRDFDNFELYEVDGIYTLIVRGSNEETENIAIFSNIETMGFSDRTLDLSDPMAWT